VQTAEQRGMDLEQQWGIKDRFTSKKNQGQDVQFERKELSMR
jgi:hypothetical protein